MRRVLAADEKPLLHFLNFPATVYVLHALQRKSPFGSRTAKRNVDLVADRFKSAERDHEEHYGKSKR